MRTLMMLASLSLALAAGCAAKQAAAPAAPQAAATEAPALRKGLNIKLTTIYVDDQEKALRFYTDVLGFVVKDDETNESYRWLSVTAAGDSEGTALQLALDDDPAAKAFQEDRFKKGQPAAMFFTSDIEGEVARIKAAGGEFTMPVTDVTFAHIAMLKDTCGNIIQITELAR